MNARNALLAAVTGFAGFMLATAGVTALLEPRVEFSILVGLPAGIVTGNLLTWFVYTRLTRPQHAGRRTALALVAGGIAFVIAMALTVTVGVGVTLSILIAVGATVVVGVGTYWTDPNL